jgi:hypothetical protein
VQVWGGQVEEVHPGDVVWFSPGEKHWHGATPTTAMTHIAIQERPGRQGRRLDGKRSAKSYTGLDGLPLVSTADCRGRSLSSPASFHARVFVPLGQAWREYGGG